MDYSAITLHGLAITLGAQPCYLARERRQRGHITRIPMESAESLMPVHMHHLDASSLRYCSLERYPARLQRRLARSRIVTPPCRRAMLQRPSCEHGER